MQKIFRLFILYLTTLGVSSCASPVIFTAIGDTPYHESDSELELLSETLNAIAQKDIPFVVHVGDIFRGWTPCSPDLYEFRGRVFQRSPIPFLVTIGDNEFNDCFDPEEAQGHFRKIILGSPPLKQSVMGFNSDSKPVHVTRQAEMIENATWSFNNIDFIMFVLPDLPGNYPLSTEKISTILDANTNFINRGFKNAKHNKRDAVVLVTHSEPALCRVQGCEQFNSIIEKEVKQFENPVLLINGSNHKRTFVDGGYQGISTWWHLRPGNTPEAHWPEISFSHKTKRFSVKWMTGPAGKE